MVHHIVKGVLHKTYFDCSIYKQFGKLICVPSLKWFESKQRESNHHHFFFTNSTVHEDGVSIKHSLVGNTTKVLNCFLKTLIVLP